MATNTNWSALSSAAALMTVIARRKGHTLTDAQRARIVWELDKYAPGFVEQPPAQIFALAEPVGDEMLVRCADLRGLTRATLEHASRVLRPRDRQTLGFVLAAAVRVAATGRELDDDDVQLVHDLWTVAKGAYGVDGAHGSIEFGNVDAMKAKKPGQLEWMLTTTPDLAKTGERLRGWTSTRVTPPGWTRGHALAFLLRTAIMLDARPHGTAWEDTVAATTPQLEAIAGPLPADAAAQSEMLYRAASPQDPLVFFRVLEDQLSWFVDLARDKQESLLQVMNVVTKMGGLTPCRIEMVTLVMTVLAQGRAAAWRLRPSPPACVRQR